MSNSENKRSINADLKTEVDTEMLEIVACQQCELPEYRGMIHWKNGKKLCRHCIYVVWRSDAWQPKETDYTFPLYEDGIDYTKTECDD